MKIKAILTSIVAISVISATVAMMTGCGEQNEDSSATSTTAGTTAAKKVATTAAATTAATGGKSDSSSANSGNSQDKSSQSSSGSVSNNNNSNDNSSSNIGISYAEAISNVEAQAGSDAQIVNAVEGKSPDGWACWVVTVLPSSDSGNNETVTYYSGYLFCYSENYQGANNNSGNSENNGIAISYDDAINNVKLQAGSGAQILSAVEGKSPEGFPCWVVTVSPVSKSGDNETVTYYSGYQFCYAEQ